MRLHLAGVSLILFGLSTVLWIALTLFESALVGISPATERVITLLLLVFPAGLGLVLGLLSLRRREGHTWLAVGGVVLNAVFAFFQLMILAFAG